MGVGREGQETRKKSEVQSRYKETGSAECEHCRLQKEAVDVDFSGYVVFATRKVSKWRPI